jgi:DeoR/GlpR family transcriptional regulator of sugar metabolism
MLSAERRRLILKQIETEGSAQINQLAERFGVSTMTIRRDLDVLEAERKIVRTRGGAMLREDPRREFPLQWKDEQNQPAKEAIARRAVQLIGSGQSVILDAGSTNLRLAREMVSLRDVVLITNDLKIAWELGDVEGIHVVLTGGQLKPQVYSLEGHYGVTMLSGVHVDTAFIGCDAFDLERGAMTNSMTKISMKQTMMKSARRRVLLADSSKFEQRALCSFAELNSFHTIVTDDGIPPECVEACQQAGIELIIALKEGSPS